MRTLVAAAIIAASSLHAQTTPAFTVVSVKPNPDPPNVSGTHQITPGHIHFVHVALQRLVLDAFGIQSYQLISTVSLAKGRWDIEATMPVDSTPEQIAAMTRTLLEDRFGLQAHREKRSIPVYVLTVAAVNKLTPTTETTGRFSIGGKGNGSPATHLMGHGTMSDLAALLTNAQLGRPVLDETGIPGRYQIDDLEYSPNDDLAFPSIFAALKERLGLKLEPGNREFDCVIVDHVNASATPNQ